MDEIEAMKAISSALEKLGPEEAGRVLSWVNAKFAGAAPQKPGAAPSDAVLPAPTLTKVTKPSKKTKTVISMDKTLNLMPTGKTSAADFAALKAPSNVREKCVVAVYYLRDILEMTAITTQAVFTFFKTVSWVAPADIKNSLQQAGSSGWLDTANSEDIKLTTLGENLVEHNLPPKAKS